MHVQELICIFSSDACARRVGKRKKKRRRVSTIVVVFLRRRVRGSQWGRAHAATVASRTRPLAARAAKSSRARPASTSKSPTVAVAAPKAKSVAKVSHRGRTPRATTETLGKGAPAPATMSPTHVAAASTSAVAPSAVNVLCANGRHAAGCRSWRCIAIWNVAPCAPRNLVQVFFSLDYCAFFLLLIRLCHAVSPLFWTRPWRASLPLTKRPTPATLMHVCAHNTP